MGSLSALLKNTSVLLASNFVTKGLSALFIVFLARYLEDYGFGQYNFAISFAAVFIIFADMGLDALTIKEVARDRSLAGEYLEAVGILRVGLAGAMVALALAAGWALGVEGHLLLVILTAGLAYMFDKVSGLFYALFRAYERMELEAAVQILWKVAQLLLGFGAIYFGFSLLGIMCVLLVSSVIKTMVGYSLVAKLGMAPKRGMSEARTLRRAYPFAAYEVGNAIYMNISIIILYLMTTPEDTGWFSAALRIIMFMLLVPSAFDAAIYPLFSRLYSSSSGDMGLAYGKSIKFTLAAAVPAAVIIAILSDELASLFGSGFGNTAECLFILAIWLPFDAVNMLMKSALWSADAQHRVALNTWAAFLILAVSTLLLVPHQGYTGAAWALVLAEASFFALNLYWVGKRNLPMGRSLWKPVLAGGCMAAAAYWAGFMAEGAIEPAWLAFLSLLVYMGVMAGLGFITKSDRALLSRVLGRHKQ